MTLGGMSDLVIPPYDVPLNRGMWGTRPDDDQWTDYGQGYHAGYWQAITDVTTNLRMDTTCSPT